MRAATRSASRVLAITTLALGCALLSPDGGEGDAPAAAGAAAPVGPPRLLDGLGDHRFPVTTSDPLARRYFDQGLALTYGFNHEAALRSFAYAAQLDPRCALCYWGQALALGPNINAPMGPEAARQAYVASERARALAPDASRIEQALIQALGARYAPEPPEDRYILDLSYANAMLHVRLAYPEDTDVATLTAESLMDLYPWNYWDENGKPRQYTEEIVDTLEWVLKNEPNHLGANHYYIHAVEEYYPEKAEAAADRLQALAPDAGHLVHMPSHIYWRVGRYDDAAEINLRAVAADEQYFSWCRPGEFYRAAYYPHNLHFLWAAASAEGRSELALTSARKLAQQVGSLHDEYPLVEEFLVVPQLTLLRFGRWDAVLGEPRPPKGRPYQLGIWHYARGIAQTRQGKLMEAQLSLVELRRIAGTKAAKQLMVAGGTASAADLLQIGGDQLDGEIGQVQGDGTHAVILLESAVARQDALVYMEPPPWYFPVRQALGAVLLEQKRAPKAEGVYRKDLEQHPKNGWSLYGLARSLEAQGKRKEAQWADEGFRNAFANADVELHTSYF